MCQALQGCEDRRCGGSLPVRLLQSLSLILSASREKNSMSSSSCSSTMLSHCQPKGEMRRQQEEAFCPCPKDEDKDISSAFDLGSPVTPLSPKNQRPAPKAHRKLEGATDV